ncbi:MAG TPA: hypothetical protein VEG44_02610 [Candidatus Acidoferrales bacterium]|nr:hypothetical protein [Candidatus Acidoferrales bacterium]
MIEWVQPPVASVLAVGVCTEWVIGAVGCPTGEINKAKVVQSNFIAHDSMRGGT